MASLRILWLDRIPCACSTVAFPGLHPPPSTCCCAAGDPCGLGVGVDGVGGRPGAGRPGHDGRAQPGVRRKHTFCCTMRYKRTMRAWCQR
eukprot:365861-Chlamydomonas_euryale.AAC.33